MTTPQDNAYNKVEKLTDDAEKAKFEATVGQYEKDLGVSPQDNKDSWEEDKCEVHEIERSRHDYFCRLCLKRFIPLSELRAQAEQIYKDLDSLKFEDLHGFDTLKQAVLDRIKKYLL